MAAKSEGKRAPEPQLRVISDRDGAPTLGDLIGKEASTQGGAIRLLRWILPIAVLAAVAYAAWTYLGGEAGYVYTTAPVTRGDLTVVVTATGTIQPVAQVDVSSAISGVVKTVNVDFNSPVKAGDVLAELDTETLDANVAAARAGAATAEAGVAKANVALRTARSAYDRQVTLFERRLISERDLETATSNLDDASASVRSAEAQLAKAKADLQLTEINRSHASITSPIDGIVLSRSISEGSTVAASLQAPVLFSIAGDLRQMEARVDVDEADIGGVAVGQAAAFRVDAYRERAFPATIKGIRFESETINNVVTYKALLDVDNSALLLRPGMTATADIVVGTVKAALLVPNAALRFLPPGGSTGTGSIFGPPHMGPITSAEPGGGQRSVWVLRDGVPAEVQVKVGATDGTSTEILSGDLAEGNAVITDAVEAE
ncbi:MAG: efflux RND transporter periplasmic adaptor subunit [Rhizobiaceae bacterium]|nr:efflux RND transporter periplasmic adaptor subunit [Rhizobiaceae bacterium]